MQKILSKFRRHESRDADAVSKGTPDEIITIQQVFHYRKQKGVNLGTSGFWTSCPLSILTNAGSWFVLERWITDSPFHHALQPAQSDLDVARGINAKQTLERHWDTWMTEEDWVWISEHGINTVRIPVSSFLLISHLSTWTFIDWLLSSLWRWSFCSTWYRFPTVSGGVRRRVAQDCPSNRNSPSLRDRRPIRFDYHLPLLN